MATPDPPVMVPSLQSYTQMFFDTDSIHILGTDHGLGPVTLHNLIVQVWESPDAEGPWTLMAANASEYIIDAATHDVLVTLRVPNTGSVLLTVLGPPVPVALTTLPVMSPTPPETPMEALPAEESPPEELPPAEETPT